MAVRTGFVERIRGAIRAHVVYLGGGGIVYRTQDVITALAGGARSAATPVLVNGINRISVCAGANDSVCLPVAAAGLRLELYNDGAAACRVFAFNGTTDTIDAVAAATGVPLTNTKRCVFECLTDGAWKSAQMGVVSA